jgi:hypothetical protein
MQGTVDWRRHETYSSHAAYLATFIMAIVFVIIVLVRTRLVARRRGRLSTRLDMCLPLIRHCRGSDHASATGAVISCFFAWRAKASHGSQKTGEKMPDDL